MSGIVKDNEFLAELDLELMGELVDFYENESAENSTVNIVSEEQLPRAA